MATCVCGSEGNIDRLRLCQRIRAITVRYRCFGMAALFGGWLLCGGVRGAGVGLVLEKRELR
jgi:hypothetical protein